MRICLLLVGLIIFMDARAQLDFLNCSDTVYCIPTVSGLPRSKGFELKRDVFTDHSFRLSDSNGESIQQSQLSQNERWSVKIKAPLMNKEHFKLAIGLQYQHEEFNFESPESLGDGFFSLLEDKDLRSIGGDIYMAKPFRGNKFLIVRFQGLFNGDYDLFAEGKADYLKISWVGLYGVKINDDKSIGLGVSYSYALGNRSILPIIAYYNTINSHWGIECVLPQLARVRYTMTQKDIFYAGARLQGANYNINLEGRPAPYFLEMTEAHLDLRYEREIHDWLWVGASLGYRMNLAFDISDVDAIIRDPSDVLSTTDVQDAMMLSLSLFIVPPRKFLE